MLFNNLVLSLQKSDVSSSDDVLLRHLQSVVSFATYEDFSLAMSELKLDVRIGDVRERMSCYLRRFLQVKSRASGLKLPDIAFLNRFARGILPVGLLRSHTNDAPENLTNPISSLY
ncbi:hypothetical protein P9112_013516 [Eukaryota sp. TZLM1-RC]